MAESTVLAGVAAKKFVERVAEDLYAVLKTQGEAEFKAWRIDKSSDSISKRIRQLRLVKTLWQLEKEVDLTDFYCPARVRVDKARVRVNRLRDLKYDGSIVLEGTAGQGKSTLLRYLATVEFFSSRRIPVLLELRKAKPGVSLLDMLLSELDTLGLRMSEGVFRLLADKGKLLILLDAFDEAPEEVSQDLVAEIEGLIRRHDQLQVVVTSRPHSSISASAHLRVFQVCPLENREYEDVIRRMAHSGTAADAIIAGVNKDPSQIRHLLSTPLMVALLLVRFNIDQSIPENRAAFYDSLFTLLLHRHDKTKAGFVRPRKSGLPDQAIQDFFNALCYVTRKSDASAFTRKDLVERGRQAGELVKSPATPEKVVKDILDITCVITSDGDDYRFIHRSVQEYHAALFVKSQPDDSAGAFYDAMQTRWVNWRQELRFLAQIDRYRFLKRFHVPQLELLFADLPVVTGLDSVGAEHVDALFGIDELELRVHRGEAFVNSWHFKSLGTHWPLWIIDGPPAWSDRLVGSPSQILSEIPALPSEGPLRVTVSQMLQSEKLRKALVDSYAESVFSLYSGLRECRAFIQATEERRSVFEF